MNPAGLNTSAAVSSRKLFWVIIFNLGITIAEVIGGLITGYLALLADAVHNFSDVLSLVLAWYGAKQYDRPATKRTTFGHKRMEVLTALISAISLIVIALFLFKEAWERYLNPQDIINPAVFISVAVIGLLGNLGSIWVLAGERGKSLNMKGAFLHMFYDALSSAAVIAGGFIIVFFGWMEIDVVLTCIIGIMIFWSSYLVIRDAVWIFLEAVPRGMDFDEVLKGIEQIPRVRGVHDLHIWSLSSTEVALSCHILLDAGDYSCGPDVIIDINNMLKNRFSITHPTIQLEKSEQYASIPKDAASVHRWE
jgi:cobalt-zinc-cadmium efflux system protein